MHKPAVPVPYYSMSNTGGTFFYNMALNTFTGFSSFRQISSMFCPLLCYNVLQFGHLPSLFCLLILSIAAGKKLLDANCVSLLPQAVEQQ